MPTEPNVAPSMTLASGREDTIAVLEWASLVQPPVRKGASMSSATSPASFRRVPMRAAMFPAR